MRNISFTHTTDQILARTKTVTRRLGWKTLQPGTLLCACWKTRGVKREEIKRLATIRVVSVSRETLSAVRTRPEDIVKEGYPGLDADVFIQLFCQQMGCAAEELVTRIEFAYLD